MGEEEGMGYGKTYPSFCVDMCRFNKIGHKWVIVKLGAHYIILPTFLNNNFS